MFQKRVYVCTRACIRSSVHGTRARAHCSQSDRRSTIYTLFLWSIYLFWSCSLFPCNRSLPRNKAQTHVETRDSFTSLPFVTCSTVVNSLGNAREIDATFEVAAKSTQIGQADIPSFHDRDDRQGGKKFFEVKNSRLEKTSRMLASCHRGTRSDFNVISHVHIDSQRVHRPSLAKTELRIPL